MENLVVAMADAVRIFLSRPIGQNAKLFGV